MNTSVEARNACYVRYDRSTNAMYLVDDAGTGLLVPLTPGSSGSQQNSQCLLSGSGSSVVTSGNTLTWNVALTFKSAFAGAKTVFLLARDTTNLESGWQARGTWTAVGTTNAPTADSVTPSSGSGASQTFSAQFSDPNGFADLTQVFFLMNTTVDPRNACYFRYDRSSNIMYLVDDAGTGLLGPLAPGPPPACRTASAW